jgi:hypothetical protein
MARGIIGGIVLSTLVTLVLVPVFYMLVERLRSSSGRLLTVPVEGDGQAPLVGAPGEVTGIVAARIEDGPVKADGQGDGHGHQGH